MKLVLGKLNQWQVFFSVGSERYAGRGWYVCDFGIINIHKRPEEGFWLSRKDYRGFRTRFAYGFPCTLINGVKDKLLVRNDRRGVDRGFCFLKRGKDDSKISSYRSGLLRFVLCK